MLQGSARSRPIPLGPEHAGTMVQSISNTLFYNFGEHKPGSGEPSPVVIVLVNVVIVSLDFSMASCFFSFVIIQIFQTRKAKLTVTKKQKHTASTIKNGVNSKIKV